MEKRKETKSITYISLLSRPWNVLIFVLSIRQFVVSFFLTIRLSDDLRCFWGYTHKAGIIGLNRRITRNLFTLNKNDLLIFQLVLQRMPLGYSAIAPLLFGAIKVLVCSQRDYKPRPAGLGTAFCLSRPLKPTRLGWNETRNIKHVKWPFVGFLFSYWYLLENSLVRCARSFVFWYF